MISNLLLILGIRRRQESPETIIARLFMDSKDMTASELYKVRQFLKREKASREYIEARAKREYIPQYPKVSDEEARAILGPS